MFSIISIVPAVPAKNAGARWTPGSHLHILKFRFVLRAIVCLPQIPRFRRNPTHERGRGTQTPNLFPRLRFALRDRRNA